MTKQEKVIVSAYTGVLMCDMLCRKLRQSQKMTL